ncbi:MAG: TIR domain-containing protein [Saprospiraceae bacterium]|nr:TIR domain-containing protein [Saprospiraceae bacterium]
MTTKEKVQELIANGQTEEALVLVAQIDQDAILLQARYSNGKKQYNMGLVDFGEWQRIQNQVNYALLELADKATSKAAGSPLAPPAPPASQYQVFISYNHSDDLQARLVKRQLEDNGIKVYIDHDMPAGMFIDKFIDEGLAQSNFLLPIISRNSLASGWVNKEVTAGFLAQRITSKKVIPVRLDDAVFDAKFYLDAMVDINKKVEEIKSNAAKALELNIDLRAFQDDLSNQRDLQANLGTMIETLKKVNVIDLSDGKFELGMSRVISTIKAS